MYDAIVAADVPADGWAVAGYVNGQWPDFGALETRFPSLKRVSITVNAQGTAMVLDVENKDATPAEAPGWAQRMRAAGIPYPVVYMNFSTWQTVKDEFAAQSIEPPLYWVAQYDGIATVPAGAIAKQHTNTSSYDVSAAADYWPGLDPAPLPTTTTPISTETDVTTYFPIEVLPDGTGVPNQCGTVTWPQGQVHVVQLLANPGAWGAQSGQFRLVFQQTTGPDVETVAIAETAEKLSVELSSVKGLVQANCSGLFITRPDGQRWPWGGGCV